MTRAVALLRAVNVGGHKKIAMADLRALAEGLGFADAETILQSGNLAFDGGRSTAAALEKKLEAEAERRLGLETDFHVRTAKEWAEIVAKNPFPDFAADDPSHLVVMLFKTPVKRAALEALRAAVKGPELIEAAGRQLYVTYPEGIGRSRLTNALIESKLGAAGTGRNWNTVLKLQAAVEREERGSTRRAATKTAPSKGARSRAR